MNLASDGLPAWRRNVAVIAMASFVVSLAFVFIQPILPLLMRQMVGNTGEAATWAGVAFGITPLCSLLTFPIWGRLADRFGHRAMVIRTHIAIAGAMGLMAVATSPEQIVGLRIIIGFFGSVNLSVFPAAAASTPREHAARAMSWIQISQVSAMIAGPAVGGVLGDLLGLQLPFVVGALLTVVSLVLVVLLFREPPRRTAETARSSSAVGEDAAPKLPLWLFWIALFLGVFTDSVFGPLLPLYLAHLGAPAERLGTVTGLGLALAGITAALAAYFAPRYLAGREPQAIRLALAGGLLLALPAGLATQWWQIVPLRALVGLVSGTTTSLAYGQAARLAKPGQEGVAMSRMVSGNMVGWATGSLTSGFIASVELRAPFFMLSLALVAGVAIWSYYLARQGQLPARSGHLMRNT